MSTPADQTSAARPTPPAEQAPHDGPRPVRDLAERLVDGLVRLDPVLATQLGTDPLADGLPDLSSAGAAAREELLAATAAELAGITGGGAPVSLPDAEERRCATLLAERLQVGRDEHAAGEHLRAVGVLFSPVQQVRAGLLAMPTGSPEAVAAAVRRTGRVAEAFDGYTRTLRDGLRADLPAGPAQVRDVVAQLDTWAAAAGGRGWFAEHLDGLLAGLPDGPPDGLGGDAARAGASAQRAVTALRTFLAEEYLPAVATAPDPVGRERYLLGARRWTGARLDLEAVYAWGWEELARVRHRMSEEAQRVLPGADPATAMAHLDEHGPAVVGAEPMRQHLQALMDRAVADLDGAHFDIEGPVRVVEARLAPAGSAAAPYYTRPSLDFSRPGRTWLPTLGRDRFPLWDVVSTWYHEGVPGHHLQLATWTALAGRLTRFQLSVGSVSAATEGWALYAETLMDELGYLADPGERMGYLNAQALRAARVVVDIGMHLGLRVPERLPDQVRHLPGLTPGGPMTPEAASALLAATTRLPAEFLRSEVVRYLGMPGQAISYKLGERAWLAGRRRAQERARAAGAELDLKAWHSAALRLGPLGLDDLEDELAGLG